MMNVKKCIIGLLLFLFITAVFGGEAFAAAEDQSAIQRELNDQKDYAQKIEEDLDFSDISGFLAEEDVGGDVTFEGLVEGFIKDGVKFDFAQIGEAIKNLLFKGILDNKQLFVEMLLLALAFSILKNFSKSFSDSYISEVCFLLFYSMMMVLLLKSFLNMDQMVKSTLDDMVVFMKVFIPTYCTAISFSLNLTSSAAFYTMIFLVIFIMQWLISYLLIPLVEIYVLIQFLNHLMEDERFGKMAELLEDAVRYALKIITTIVLGINIVQGMVAPAMDRLAGTTLSKTVKLIPGVGNVVSTTGQLIISSGIAIKNCVGAAALIILVVLCGAPFIQMAITSILYKVMSAILEPVTDKRIAGGISGIAGGGLLYLKIMSTCLMLFFLTIALTSVATSMNTGG